MSYIICKDPFTQLNLTIEKHLWPKLVSNLQRCECTYAEEKEFSPGNGKTYITIKDIQAPKGYELGALLGLFYGMEWESMKNGEDRNFYIYFGQRKREKKNVHEDWKETSQGGESGDRGEPAGDIRPGQDVGCDSVGAEPAVVHIDDLRELEVLEETVTDDCE